MKYLCVLLVVCSMGGCCWTAKRDCFPPCPAQEIITVEKTCTLPPGPTLLGVKRTDIGCPENLICYDVTNAAYLAQDLSVLKEWVKEAKEKCGTKTSSSGTPNGTK
jgi:hypothetical protein